MSTKDTSTDPIVVPYLGPTGRPYHTLNEPQRRWLTKGLLTTQEEADLVMHGQMISERVQHWQEERKTCRRKAGELLKVNEGTSQAERDRRMAEVVKLQKLYAVCGTNVEALKSTVLEITPGALMLPEII